MFILWISIFLFFLLAEMGIPGSFFSLSISYGALVGLLAKFCDASVEMQVSCFLVGAVVGFYSLRSVASKIQSKGHIKLGIEGLKGTIAVMLSEADNIPGTVHVAGTTWSARSGHFKKICTGEWVRIIDIKGTVLIVEPLKKHEETTCTISQ